MTGPASDVLAQLNAEQREAATILEGPLVIKAGPGSGKTRTVTHRIAYGVQTGFYEPQRTLALTFTTRAAAEVSRRLAALGAGEVAVRTFHSAALRQLRFFWADAIGGEPARIESRRHQLIAQALEELGQTPDSDTVSAVITELDWTKAQGITPDDYVAQADAHRREPSALPSADVAAALATYETVKSQRGVIDFDDVLLVTIALLQSRSDVRESVRRAFRWITVDEYQDVSPLQERLLDLWVGGRDQLCVVGDAAQSIYQFAGADPTLLTTFTARYPDAQMIELPTTYRCLPAIATVANRLARDIPQSLQLRPEHRSDSATGSVQVLQFPNDDSEARGVADEITSLIEQGHEAREIACLYRVHYQGRSVQDELRSRGIAFCTRGSDRFFDRAEVKEAITRFRGEVRIDAHRTAAETMRSVFTSMGHESAPPANPVARDRWESLASLAELFAMGAAADSAEAGLSELERRAAEQEPPPPAGVSLLTLHAAKGLEWDTVFVIGAWDGSLPLARARSDEAQQEERRLAYVGFTRARRRLMVTWATQGSRGGRRAPSPYLSAIANPKAEPAVPGLGLAVAGIRPGRSIRSAAERAGAGLAPARCRVCGHSLVTGAERVLGRCRTCPAQLDLGLFSRLRRWRDSVAAELGQPPYAVLTDATLRAIAEQTPGTRADLASIPGLHSDKLRQFADPVIALVTDAAPAGVD